MSQLVECNRCQRPIKSYARVIRTDTGMAYHTQCISSTTTPNGRHSHIPKPRQHTLHSRAHTHPPNFGRDVASKRRKDRRMKARSSIGVTIVRTPSTRQYRQELRNIIWPNPKSILSAQDYRNRIWLETARNFVGKPEQSDKFQMSHWTNRDIDPPTLSEIEMLLDRSEIYRQFLISELNEEIQFQSVVKSRFRKILSAYANANDQQFPLLGILPICAVLSTKYNNDDDVFYLLQVLTQLMEPYYENNQKLIRDEVLILTEVLCERERELVQHLNEIGIDLIDLGDICRSWIQALFVHHFDVDFVLRVIDLVLLEGASVLVTLVYGIFVLVKEDICSKCNDADVFDFLMSEVPNILCESSLIERVVENARVLYSRDMYEYVQNHRRNKSWDMCLKLPGVVHIVETVGNRDVVSQQVRKWEKESRAHYNLNITSPEFDDEVEDDGDDIEAIRSENEKLQREVELLRRQNEKLISSVRVNASHQHSVSDGWVTTIRKRASGMDGSDLDVDEKHVECASESSRGHSRNSTQSDADWSNLGVPHAGLAANLINNNNEIDDNVPIREIQCSHNNWALLYRDAMETIHEPCAFMQGHLVKLNSRWTRPGSNIFDTPKKRWFVLNDRYLAVSKSRTDKTLRKQCLDLRGYVIRACEHPKADAALEVISPAKFKAKRTKDSSSLERTKFYLLAETFRERDLWVAALKFAADRGGRLFPEFSHTE